MESAEQIKEEPVYIAPGEVMEDGKGGKVWQELPELTYQEIRESNTV